MGLSVARSLSGRGHDVTVLERGSTPNPSASSFDEQRLIRYAYGSMAGYAAMVGDAYRAWDRLWEELGRVLYRETGTLALAGPGGLWVGETAGTLEAMGIGAEWLSPEGLESRYPLLATEGVERALYLPTGGILFASRILEGLAGGLRRAGVVVRDRTEAVEVDPARSEVRSAAGDRFGADAIVVATGAWAPRLLPALAPRLRPSRQVGLYLAPPADLAPAWAAMPMVLDLDPEGGFYAVPPVAGTRMKTGDHRFSLSGDPALPEPAGDDELAPLLSTCSARLRDFHRFREAGRGS